MVAGFETQQLVLLFFVFIACGGLIVAVFLPLASPPVRDLRVKPAGARSPAPQKARQATAGNRTAASQKDERRKQIQETLKQFEESQKQRRQRVTLRVLIGQAGLRVSPRKFWLASAGIGLIAVVLALVLQMPLYVALLSGVVGFLGLPRWALSYLRKRRRNAFINQFPDAIDVMVRGLKAGLPIIDTLKVIAEEMGPPVGPEFLDVVEGLRIGLTIEQGLERMYERIPTPEVNFLSIAFSIQSKSGGNMSEALSNLSRVLRGRRKMKGKVEAVSQEAKSSAAIIGALPFVITALLAFINPTYIMPLFESETGHMMLAAAIGWMVVGVVIMRKMIQFDI
jgi:tight adherence protein B